MPLYPVSKNGKFLGYADESQIANNAALKVFDEAKVKAVEAETKVAAAETVRKPVMRGAHADAVRKSPAK